MKKASVLILAGLLFGLVFAGRLAAQAKANRSSNQLDSSGIASPPTHFWLTEHVTTPDNFFHLSTRSFVLDAAGHPHIVYGHYNLNYAWYDGSNWHHERLGPLDSYAAYPVIILDDGGNPHIVYSRFGELWYAYRSGNQWLYSNLEVIALPFQGTAASPSLAFDSLGYLHIAYASGENGIQYLYQTGGGWFNQTVDEGEYRASVSLALDASDTPHLSYTVAEDYLRYAHRQGGEWHIETLWPVTLPYPNFVFVRTSTSIALDSQGQPAIAFQAGEGIMFASHSAAGWTIQTVNNDVFGLSVSLALDAGDIPHLGYYNSFTDGPTYATRPADTWLKTDVEYDGTPPTIQVDPAGRPHMIYLTVSGVRYAYLSTNGWTFDIVDTAQSNQSPMMAIDGSDRLHLMYQALPDGAWQHAVQTEEGWSTEAITLPVTTFTADTSGNLHLLYNDSNGNLGYAYRAGNQWSTEVITGPFSTPVQLVLDEQQNPHVTFYGPNVGPLEYAYRTGTGWSVQTVDANVPIHVWRYVSLQLDDLNQPHLVYPFGNQDLIYAHWQNDQWFTETLTSEVELAWLALDSLDRPHIAYSKSSFPGNLHYLYWNGSNWSGEEFDTYTSIPRDASHFLALDSQDRPCILYRQPLLGSWRYYLMYACKNDQGTWLFSAIDQYEQQNTSLLLNSQDMPFILYLDGLSKHIKLSSLAADLTYAPLIAKP